VCKLTCGSSGPARRRVWAWVLCGYKQRVCEEKVKLEEIDDQGKFPFSLCFGFSVDSFFLCKLYCIVDPIGNHTDSGILQTCRSGLANSRGEQLPVRRRLEVLGRTRERKGAGQKERGRRRASHRLHRLRPPLSASALSSHRGRRSTGVRWVAARPLVSLRITRIFSFFFFYKDSRDVGGGIGCSPRRAAHRWAHKRGAGKPRPVTHASRVCARANSGDD
jgi:hypothetical protein